MSHDPSEIILICWVAAQETFLIIINAENSLLRLYKPSDMLFSGVFAKWEVQNNSI